VRLLFISGYTEDVIRRQRSPEADGALLQKPFSSIALARTVREVLDAHEP
jgi:two-component system cell cycle sensor histidine kinase/response regulator CckA